MGGGLAGLAAGYELSKAGKYVEVYEKWEEVGGLARTIKKGKFLFDTGPHRWYAKNDKVNNWMLELMGKEIIKVPRLTRIYFDHHFFYYPIRIFNALSGIGILRAFWSIIDYIKARLKHRLFKPKLLTMEDGYINQFGKTLYEIFFKRYSEKLWGQDCTKISIDWVGQRTRGLNIFTLIKESIFKSKSVVSLVDEFFYPEKGVGRIAQKMAEEIIKNKGRIVTNAEIFRINRKDAKIVSVSVRIGMRVETVNGTHFISSIPLNDLIDKLSPKADKNILALSGKLTYRDELQVALFIKKVKMTPDTWLYVHPKEIPFMRMMEMDNWSSLLSPKGTTTLVFELACNEGDALWRKKDKAVIDLTVDSFIKEFGLIEKKDIIGGYVHRVPKEYPVYHIGYRLEVNEIIAYTKKFQNLSVVGRNGTFRYNNMDHSIEMGMYAAANIIEGRDKYDIQSVNIEREYLEEKKIENIEDEAVEEPARKKN